MKVIWGVTSAVSTGFCQGRPAFMAQRGIEITVLSAPGEQLNAISRDGIATVSVPMEREISPIQDCKSLFQLYRVLRRMRPDITEFGTPKAGFLGMLAAWVARVPCRIYTIHGLRFETKSGPIRVILSCADRIASACATRVICVSESLREKVIALKLAPIHKTCVLNRGTYMGVDTERFTPKSRRTEQVARLRQSLRLTGNEKVIGFVGRFVKDKGIRELAEAFRELSPSRPELRLLLVGDYETGDPVEPEIRRYIDATPTILRTGFVADTAPYYALMDVFVLPTYREGFPGVPLEAQASEVPVVTTRATGAVDSVQHGTTGLIVPPKDTSALTEAINALLGNPQMRVDMGYAGRKWMERDFHPEAIWQAHAEMYRGILKEHSQRKRERRLGLAAKRAFDLFVAMAALIILSPLMAATALVVRTFLGSPVLFRQVRPGYKARPFTCLKFRTMRHATDSAGLLLPDADRLTRVGIWIRKLSLDELPQLWNVLRGDMSLVGPRPLLMRYLPYFTENEDARFEAMPGLTGLAQVNGRNNLTWDDRLAMDVNYVNRRSLLLDFKILVMTVLRVVQRDGLQVDPGAAMLDLDEQRKGRCQQSC
jgi:lipopolysaccharide/colanic/teichoic acid biosynthesis glycosyltransferase